MFSHPLEHLHFILICMCAYLHIYTCVYVCVRCPDGGAHSKCALLLPRVYLQTVTLMQRNDYFYSRYFGSPFPLSGMAPHWPTDYLCGCCHTWLLQLTSLSTIAPWEPSSFITTSSPLSVNLQLCATPSFSLFALHLYHPLLSHYTFTPLPPLM